MTQEEKEIINLKRKLEQAILTLQIYAYKSNWGDYVTEKQYDFWLEYESGYKKAQDCLDRIKTMP
jgi:hypothetical protein